MESGRLKGVVVESGVKCYHWVSVGVNVLISDKGYKGGPFQGGCSLLRLICRGLTRMIHLMKLHCE